MHSGKKKIVFEVPIEPMGQGRGRAVAFLGKARIYVPDKTRKWQDKFLLMSSRYMPPEPLRGAVGIDAQFYFRRPQRLNKKKDPETKVPHEGRPDIDNCLKIVLDSIHPWFEKSDAQVQTVSMSKWYAEKEKLPRVQITIWEIENEHQGSNNS